jgi:hypothetical protein
MIFSHPIQHLLALAIIALGGLTTAIAKPVDLATARQVAISHFRSMSDAGRGASLMSVVNLTLADQRRIPVSSGDSMTACYVFNAPDNSGFVIVAGDDAVAPLLGYSGEGHYSTERPSPEFLYWMHGYERQLAAVAERHIEATASTRALWLSMSSGKSYDRSILARAGAVAPLLRTEWNQNPYYNDQCPYDEAAGERTVTGCVATAFAQIMKYHNWPAQGMGDHGYSHPRYGYIHATYAGVTYDWNAMPDQVTEPNAAVAQLMFHVGVASDMYYGTASGEGSLAWPKTTVEGLKRYFGYRESVHEVYRKDYDDASWLSLIRSELDAARPLEYDGFSNDGSGHSFVLDGYQGEYFHVNWGWGGQFNGYFLLSDLTPSGTGTGGGGGSYNSDQAAVIGIAPEKSAGQTSLQLYTEAKLDHEPIHAGEPFTLSTDFVNWGESDFSGEIAVRAYTIDGREVGLVESRSGLHLGTGMHWIDGVTFSCGGLNVEPGRYMLKIFSRQEGGEWELVNPDRYTNPIIVEILAPHSSGVDEEGANSSAAVNVYPLPAAGEIFVDLLRPIGHLRRISIIDQTGRLLLERTGQLDGNLLRLDLSALPSGAYRLLIDTDRGILSRPVVIRR